MELISLEKTYFNLIICHVCALRDLGNFLEEIMICDDPRLCNFSIKSPCVWEESDRESINKECGFNVIERGKCD